MYVFMMQTMFHSILSTLTLPEQVSFQCKPVDGWTVICCLVSWALDVVKLSLLNALLMAGFSFIWLIKFVATGGLTSLTSPIDHEALHKNNENFTARCNFQI